MDQNLIFDLIETFMGPQKPYLSQTRRAEEFFTDEGCFISEWSNSAKDPGLSVARARVEPGVTTRWHRLRKQAERYVILSGQGRVELGGEVSQDVAEGDVIIIPAMCRQRITNTGTEDLVFLALCSPRFRVEDYEDVDS